MRLLYRMSSENSEVYNMTVTELRETLRAKGLAVHGNKAELINRLVAAGYQAEDSPRRSGGTWMVRGSWGQRGPLSGILREIGSRREIENLSCFDGKKKLSNESSFWRGGKSSLSAVA